MVDVDFLNLNKNHINELIGPILNKEADMVPGQTTETLINL